MPTSRTWYVSCSPRSPEKIAPELVALSAFEGVRWRERDTDGVQIHQVAFAEALARLESFEGRISATDPALSARDRLAPMQTYGFAFIDGSGKLRITPAGRRLAEGLRVHEVFLKQLLKWQYPSWQHGGNPRTRYKYPPLAEMDVFPFVETLRACRELEGLNKDEVAIFLLPVLNRRDIPTAIRAISNFRTEIRRHRGLERTKLVQTFHRDSFAQFYASEIRRGDITTRESPTKTADD